MRLLLFFSLAIFGMSKNYNRHMQPVDLTKKPMRNHLHQYILEYTGHRLMMCTDRWREKKSSGECGEKGHPDTWRDWKKCGTVHKNCRRKIYYERPVVRWLKMAACNCLNKPDKEKKKQKRTRIGMCRVWGDFLGKNYGKFTMKNTDMLEAIKDDVRTNGKKEQLESCSFLFAANSEYGHLLGEDYMAAEDEEQFFEDNGINMEDLVDEMMENDEFMSDEDFVDGTDESF